MIRVYPRVCGGTRLVPTEASILSGLSPRVRGNHSPVELIFTPSRSIPACAGEPLSAANRSSLVWGLSPRVRGNLLQLEY